MTDSERSRKRSDSEEIWVLDFTPESAQDFRERLLEENRANPNKPIIVYIDSYGGQVDALAKMIATMDEVSNPIITACMGKAMSCGAILLSHGDIRYCDDHSRVMIHKVSAATAGDTEDIANDAAEFTRLNNYWMSFVAANCNLKGGHEELEKIMKSKEGRDRYMTAKDALDFGIVDVVGKPKIISATMYEVVSVPDKMPIKKRATLRAQYSKKVNKEVRRVRK